MAMVMVQLQCSRIENSTSSNPVWKCHDDVATYVQIQISEVPYDQNNNTGFQCPVGEPYPWIYEIPRIITQNVTSALQPKPSGEIFIKVLLYVIAIALALCGNSLVILVVAKNKKMWNRTNFYVTNLAVSDLMVVAFCMWIHLGSSISPDYPWGAGMCSFSPFVKSWSVTASVLFMAVIAADRFFVIVFPLKARGSGNVAAIVTISTWLLAGLVACPNLFVFKLFKVYWKDQTEYLCDEAWPRFFYKTSSGVCLYHMPSQSIYWILYCTFFYFLPLLAMTAAYVLIVQTLWNRKVDSPSRGIHSNVSTLHKKTRKKVVKMLLAVLIGFIICWTPFQVLQLYNATRSLDNPLPNFIEPLIYFATFLAYFNSALNPILYAGLNESFRIAFKELLCGKKKNRTFPDLRTTPMVSRGSPQETQQTALASQPEAPNDSQAMVYTISTRVHLEVPKNPYVISEVEEEV